MTLQDLALKNLRHQVRNYLAFFLSSTFAAWLFYLYGSLLLHPNFQRENVPELVWLTLVGLELIVALFAILFIAQAHGAFFRARQKDLGLLSLMGMEPARIGGMIVWENLLIGLAATAAGILLGTICMKLFFLGIGTALGLGQPFAFHFSGTAVGLTVATFAAIFGCISVQAMLRVRRLSLATLFRGAIRPRPTLQSNPLLVTACMLTLGGTYGYGLATGLTIHGLLPILAGLLVGTYLLFSQASVALLGWLRSRPNLYWHPVNLIAIAGLVSKLRENVRILFMVSILCTMVLVALGINYSGLLHVEENAQSWSPVGVLVEGEPTGLTPDRTLAVLSEYGVKVSGQAHVPVLRALYLSLDGRSEPVMVMARSDFNRWAEQVLDRRAIDVTPGHAVVVGRLLSVPNDQRTITLSLGAQRLSLPLGGQMDLAAFHMSQQVVVDDRTFAEWQARFGQAHGLMLHGYALERWQRSGPALEQLQREVGPVTSSIRGVIPGLPQGPVVGTHSFYTAQKTLNAMGLFLTSFIGLLFFLAAGHMLYFKLFGDLAEDQRQFHTLTRLGIRPREVGQIVSRQTMVLFFLPLLVGIIHAALLQSLVASYLGTSIGGPLAVVSVICVMFQGGYYLVTRRIYLQAILRHG